MDHSDIRHLLDVLEGKLNTMLELTATKDKVTNSRLDKIEEQIAHQQDNISKMQQIQAKNAVVTGMVAAILSILFSVLCSVLFKSLLGG